MPAVETLKKNQRLWLVTFVGSSDLGEHSISFQSQGATVLCNIPQQHRTVSFASLLMLELTGPPLEHLALRNLLTDLGGFACCAGNREERSSVLLLELWAFKE